MATILDLARNVDRAKAQLERAQQDLLNALTGTPLRRQNMAARQVRRGPGSDSVAARVLSLVTDAGPAGLSRADINAAVPGHEAAVHSALKKYSTQKRMESIDGQWKLVVRPVVPKAPKAAKK